MATAIVDTGASRKPQHKPVTPPKPRSEGHLIAFGDVIEGDFWYCACYQGATSVKNGVVTVRGTLWICSLLDSRLSPLIFFPLLSILCENSSH